MSQSTPLIRIAADQAHEVKEIFLQLSADGEVCSDDINVLRPLIADLKQATHEAELAYAWGMAVFKRGIDGKRAREIELENERLADRHPLDAA